MSHLPSNSLSIPTFGDIVAKENRGETLTALETFVYDNEPADEAGERVFRTGLLALLREARSAPEPGTLRAPIDGPFDVWFKPDDGTRGVKDDRNGISLTVHGFVDQAEHYKYCEELANTLNAAAQPPQASDCQYCESMRAEHERLRHALATASAQPPAHEPDAYMRCESHNPCGPDPEQVWSYEFASREDRRQGEGWVPLYARASDAPAEPTCLLAAARAVVEAVNRTHDPQGWFESLALLKSEVARRAAQPPGALHLDQVKATCHALTDNCVMVDDPERPICTSDNCAAMRAVQKSGRAADEASRVFQAPVASGSLPNTLADAPSPEYERGFAAGSGDEGWYQRRIVKLEGLLERAQPILVAAGLYTSNAVEAKTQLLIDIASALTKAPE